MNRDVLEKLHLLGIITFPIIKNTKFPNVPKGYMKEIYEGKKDSLPISYDDNFGVVGGKNGLLVIDLDTNTLIDEFTKDRKKLYDNTVVVESGKGHHIYVNCPDAENVKLFRKSDNAEIDLKGKGGYCVGPTSYVIPNENERYKYTESKQYGFEYKLLSNPGKLLSIKWDDLKKIIINMGFEFNNKQSVLDIAKNGVKEGSRNDSLFKYLANLRGMHDFDDLELSIEAERFNKKKINPPLDNQEVRNITNSVISRVSVGGDRIKHDNFVKEKISKSKNEKIQEIHDFALRFIQEFNAEADSNEIKIQIYEDGYYKIYRKEQLAIKITKIYMVLHSDALEITHWILAMAPPIKARVCGPYVRFKNGLYNFNEKRLEDFDPEKYTLISYDFDMIETPEPEKFLDAMSHWFPDPKYRRVAYKVIYESLLPKKSLKFHQLLGDGGNGKTQFRQMIAELIPDYAITTKLDLLVNDTFSSTVLDGNTVILCSETPNNIEQFDMIKRMTGDDILSIRGMRQAPKQIVNMTTLLLDSNQSVRFDESLSMIDRIHIVPFLNRIRNTDGAVDDFGRKLAHEEMHHIICWILQNQHICNSDWLDHDDCSRLMKEFGDCIEKFVSDGFELTKDEMDTIKGKQLFIEYKRWCKKNGKSNTTRQLFYEGLDSLELDSEYGIKGVIKYMGIKRKEPQTKII